MQVGSASSENQSDNTIDLTALQEEDGELTVVRSWVKQSVKPNFNALSSERYALKSLWPQFPCFELRDGLLVQRVEDTDNDTVAYQALVPRKAETVSTELLSRLKDIRSFRIQQDSKQSKTEVLLARVTSRCLKLCGWM